MAEKVVFQEINPDCRRSIVASEEFLVTVGMFDGAKEFISYILLPTESALFEPVYLQTLTEDFKKAVETTAPELTFGDTKELSFNVSESFLKALDTFYTESFSKVPAFGMWNDLEETDEELLKRLGGQWEDVGE